MWISFLLWDGAGDIKTHKISQSTHNPTSLDVFVELPVCMPMPSEMQKVADAADISVLLFSAGANF